MHSKLRYFLCANRFHVFFKQNLCVLFKMYTLLWLLKQIQHRLTYSIWYTCILNYEERTIFFLYFFNRFSRKWSTKYTPISLLLAGEHFCLYISMALIYCSLKTLSCATVTCGKATGIIGIMTALWEEEHYLWPRLAVMIFLFVF